MMFNKTKLIIIFLLCSLLLPVFADDERLHAVVSTGNDMWNFGLSENYDDQLSYSLNTKLAYKNFSFKFDAECYTNRGYNDAYIGKSGGFYHGRYDKLNFLPSYLFKINFSDNWQLNIQPTVGAVLLGEFNLDFYQNTVHRLSKLNEVELPYDFDASIFRLALNGDVSLSYKTAEFEHSMLKAKLRFITNNTINFETSQEYRFEIALDRKKTLSNLAYFFVGFGDAQSNSNSLTENLYTNYIKGFNYGFGLSSGFVSVDYKKFYNTGFGFTYLSFDVASLFRKREFYEEDFWVSYGKTFLFNRDYNDNTIGIRFNNISILVKNRYVSGYPIMNVRDYDSLTRYKRNYTLNSIGVRYEHPLFKNKLFTVYSQILGGLSLWNFAYLYNQDKSSTTFDKKLEKQLLFFGDLEVGLTVFPEGLLIIDNSQYQFNLFGGLSYFPQKESITKILTRDLTYGSYWDFSGFAFYWGFGVRVGIDV